MLIRARVYKMNSQRFDRLKDSLQDDDELSTLRLAAAARRPTWTVSFEAVHLAGVSHRRHFARTPTVSGRHIADQDAGANSQCTRHRAVAPRCPLADGIDGLK